MLCCQAWQQWRGGGKSRDAGGRGGGRREHSSRVGCKSASKDGASDQSKVDKVTWLQANKYYTAKEYTKFTAAKKAWVYQNRTKSPATKRKVASVSRGDRGSTRKNVNFSNPPRTYS
jgi:hypothetical protein